MPMDEKGDTVSALDLCCIECRGWAAEEYEPRIAEMEDAKEAALSRLESAESEVDRLRTLFQKSKNAMIRAEAEMTALKARLCGGCEHADKNGDPWGCRANMLLFPKPTDCCNRWQEAKA